MNKYKGFTTFLALIMVFIPAVSFSDSVYVIEGLNEPAPVYTPWVQGASTQTQSQPQIGVATYVIPGIDDKFNYNNSNVPTNNNSVNNNTGTAGTTNVGQENKTTNPITDIFGIKIKSKAERDAEKAALDAKAAQDAENARVAYNNDGSFAYGYTNGNGAQYVNGVRYTDARTNNKARYTASAGTAMGNGFLPKTAGGWILTILLLAILVGITRAFMSKLNTKTQHVSAHAH